MPYSVRTPNVLLHSVWPLPRSLATTGGISVDFSSSPYLDVSVQAVPLIYLCIQYMMTRLSSCRIAPFGNPRIYRSLTAPRGLSQLVTSFIGSRCQGIPLVLFVAWPLSRLVALRFSSNNFHSSNLFRWLCQLQSLVLAGRYSRAPSLGASSLRYLWFFLLSNFRYRK